ncbi:hypothetical protein GCM10008023_17930 [Sphingomonas glacialis]|uniref:Spore coat protein U domain-containing protein n=1 Tax=Sphingomonas glacialis TaxID=658225 RepID=A0ABQ3LG92_9SPHN|nr:hypothetical protein [Sphingomonas glacialis]GHH15296.1 hypothetical protein GCM10008023_17930 [Sphingomonas glacialis]
MRIALLLATLTIALPTATFAQTSSAGVLSGEGTAGARDLVVEGTAPPGCVIGSPSATEQDNARVTVAQSGGLDVALGGPGFINPLTGVPNPAAIRIALPITCNTAHRIQIESRNGGLVNEATSGPTGALRNRLDFSVSLEWAGTSAGFDTSTARTVQTLVGNAATGTAQIGIRIPGGGTPLVAGIYNDTVTIRVEATS